MEKRTSKLFVLGLFIVFILLISAILFFSATTRSTYSFVQLITQSTVRTEVSQFDLDMDEQIRILKAIGESFPDETDLNQITRVSQQLANYGVLYNIEWLMLIRKDGTGISYNNQTSHFHFSDSYSLFSSGNESSTGIEIPDYKDEPYFYIAIPIHRNGEVAFVLKAYYGITEIKRLLVFPFIEDVLSGLVSQNGMTVTDSNAQFSDPLFLNEITVMNPGFFHHEINNEDYLIYHSPTSASGVYFFIEIPSKSIIHMTSELNSQGILFAITVIILCIILMYFLMKSERKQKNDILKLSEKLRQSEARYQNAFNYKDNIAWEYNPRTKELSAVIKRKDGRTQELKISNAIDTIIKNKLIHADYIAEFRKFTNQIFADPPYATCILKLRRTTSGEYYWARLSFIISSDVKTEQQTILGLIEDISDIKEVQDKYDQEKKTIDAMTDTSVCYYLLNLTNGKVIEKKSRDISAEVLEEIITIDDALINELKYVCDKDDVLKIKEVCSLDNINTYLESNKEFDTLEYKRKSPLNGTIEWISLSASIMKNSNNETIIAIQLTNIDNRKKQELLLQRRAERDLLTDLYNKMTMSQLINDYLKLQRKEGQIDALIMLDADNYKSVNDTFGHVFGDKVLIDIADSLKSCVKQSDYVGRVGGDEYMIFLKDMHSKDDMTSILKRISEGIHHTYAENDVEVTISASIGVAYVTPDITSFQPLYKLADEALYEAKESGKNCYRFAKTAD